MIYTGFAISKNANSNFIDPCIKKNENINYTISKKKKGGGGQL